MSELYATKTRLRLLGYVAKGYVYQHPDGLSHIAGGPQVTARITGLHAAGWVHINQADYTVTYWELTDAGRAVLDANGGAE